MDLKEELRESVAEAKNAKVKQDAWVRDARANASSHDAAKTIWIFMVVVLALAIVGFYTTYLSFITSIISSILGWFGLENYIVLICGILVIIGCLRIKSHINERDKQNNRAEQLESMNLTKFRRTYM